MIARLGIRWYMVVRLGIRSYMTARLGIRWYMIPHLGIRWYMIARLGIRWYMIARLGLSWYMIAHLDIRWYMIAHLGIRCYIIAQLGIRSPLYKFIQPSSDKILQYAYFSSVSKHISFASDAISILFFVVFTFSLNLFVQYNKPNSLELYTRPAGLVTRSSPHD